MHIVEILNLRSQSLPYGVPERIINMSRTDDYKSVCDKCGQPTWYETEQPCKRMITPACPACGGCEHMDAVPCTGTLRIIDRSELDPRLTPYYRTGERVKIEYADGESIRCYIGKSTGWNPIYLEILKSNSMGGSALYTKGITRITGLGKFI